MEYQRLTTISQHVVYNTYSCIRDKSVLYKITSFGVVDNTDIGRCCFCSFMGQRDKGNTPLL